MNVQMKYFSDWYCCSLCNFLCISGAQSLSNQRQRSIIKIVVNYERLRLMLLSTFRYSSTRLKSLKVSSSADSQLSTDSNSPLLPNVIFPYWLSYLTSSWWFDGHAIHVDQKKNSLRSLFVVIIILLSGALRRQYWTKTEWRLMFRRNDRKC